MSWQQTTVGKPQGQDKDDDDAHDDDTDAYNYDAYNYDVYHSGHDMIHRSMLIIVPALSIYGGADNFLFAPTFCDINCIDTVQAT